MRYVKLATTGDGNLSQENARRYVREAKARAGSPAGRVRMTAPNSAGIYFVEFENHAHATHFIDIARPSGVRLESLMALPDGITIRDAPRRQQSMAGAGTEEVVVVLLEGAADILEALFGRPGRSGNGK